MELNLYNAVLTAMSYDGREFTYVNQLASSDVDLSKREKWFTCACCPPNVLRLFGSLAGYTTSTFEQHGITEMAVHLYISGITTVEIGKENVVVRQSSHWPWEGEIKFDVTNALPTFGMAVRIPAWAHKYQVRPFTNVRVCTETGTDIECRPHRLAQVRGLRKAICIFRLNGYARIRALLCPYR
jgi:DUF1680 family protein